MSQAYKCDRCGRYFDKKETKEPGYYTILKTVDNTGLGVKEVDLCFQCEIDIDDCMKRKIFTPNEVEMIIRQHGMSDHNIAKYEIIKYPPSEISKILRESIAERCEKDE